MITRRIWLPWVIAGLAGIATWLPQPRTVDDAFITFRYSRNLVEGHGFVYNLGERVQGTTTPLYTLLMALCGAIFGEDYPQYALGVNALAAAAGVLLLYQMAVQLTQRVEVAAWLGLVWAVAPFAVTFGIGGMETSVHTLFMLGAWWAYLRDRPRWMGIACALAVLTRPDALIWALPLLAHQLFDLNWRAEKWRLPWNTWIAGGLLYAPWFLFAWAYFGSPIPHTVSTKAAVYDLSSTQGLEVFVPHYATLFQQQILLGGVGVSIGLILYPTLALIGLRFALSKTRRALPILIYPWLYFAVFTALNPLIFRWYLTPPLPAYFLAVGCGVVALAELIPRPAYARALRVGVGGAALFFTLSAWTLHPDHGPNRPAPLMAFHELELNYQKMALHLRADYGVNAETRLAAGDIGALGFYSRAYILDTVGLVTPDTLPYYADWDKLAAMRVAGANYVIPPDLILAWQPDFVVVMEDFVILGLQQDPRFTAQYHLIATIPADYYGGMVAYQRRQP